MLGKLKSRMMGLVTRTKITSSVVTGQGQIVTVSLLQGQSRDGAEVFEPYGIAGAVPEGAEGIAISVGGSSDQLVVVCASPKGSTPEGRLPGEVDLYSTHGQVIRLHTDGSISLQPGAQGFVYTGSAPNPALPLVNGHGDNCVPTQTMAAWMAQVQAALSNAAIVTLGNTIPPYSPPTVAPTTIATTVAGAKKTKVS